MFNFSVTRGSFSW